MDAADFAHKLRSRQKVVGYWVMLDAPPATERIALTGYDYVCLDWQHGMIDYSAVINGLTAIDAARKAVGLVRVGSNDVAEIGRALDAGAAGIIVPLVNTAEDAAAAVEASRYPPAGRRSYGPIRAMLRIGPNLSVADASTVVLAMIETPMGLENVEEICAVPGVDGIYVGPADLRLSVGGKSPLDEGAAKAFNAALERVLKAAHAAGIAVGIHTPDGETAARRLAEGFSFVSISGDVLHLQQVAAAHLKTALGLPD